MGVNTGTDSPDELDRIHLPDLTELFNAASGGDQDAWDALVHRFQGLVWSICRSFRLNEADSADIFQLTWLRLLDKFDKIENPAKLAGWLATTCRHECLALYRTRTRLVPIGDDEVLDRLTGPVTGVDVPAMMKQQAATVWEAFFKLGEECQKILWILVIDPPDRDVYLAASQWLARPQGSLGPKRGRCLGQLKRHLAAMGITDAEADS
jgi:RNA polymerase sigma factor (sigma-70 family)